jgi:hypothetical protein
VKATGAVTKPEDFLMVTRYGAFRPSLRRRARLSVRGRYRNGRGCTPRAQPQCDAEGYDALCAPRDHQQNLGRSQIRDATRKQRVSRSRARVQRRGPYK